MSGPPDIDTAMAWRGRTVRDREGEELGRLSELYLDSVDQRPAWAAVKRGRLRTTSTIVPLAGVTERDDELWLPYDGARFDAAPDVDPDVELTPEQEQLLYEHFEEAGPARPAVAMDTRSGDEGAVAETDTRSGAAADDTASLDTEPEGTMIRSEEEVTFGKRTKPQAERVRLKKVIVEDEVTRTVPVRREEIRLETEPPPEGQIESVEEMDEDPRS